MRAHNVEALTQFVLVRKGFPQEGTYNLGPRKLLGVSQRMGAGDGHMPRP